MGQVYASLARNTIPSQLRKNKLSKSDLCRALNCSTPTLNTYIRKPQLIRLGDLLIMAGCFGMHVETLVFLLRRCSPKIKHKKGEKQYLDSLVVIGFDIERGI